MIRRLFPVLFFSIAFGVCAEAREMPASLSIWVDKSDNTLILKKAEKIVKTYVVATGLDNSTPVGSFKVTTLVENPTWYKPGSVIGPYDRKNHLGTRWIGLNKKGYGIHGTTEPEKLGRQVSAGCIRMKNEDVDELFMRVEPGTPLDIRN